MLIHRAAPQTPLFATHSFRFLEFEPDRGLVVPNKESTWAAYWSGWQYLYTASPGNQPLEQISGEPKQQGIGVFGRFGFADFEPN